MKQKYSEEEKLYFVSLYVKGTPVKNICQTYQLPRSTFYYWIDLYKMEKSPSGVYSNKKKVYDLSKRLARIERENAILKKSNCTIDSPTEQKVAAAEKLIGEYNVHVVCDTLGLRRSTLYYHLRRKPVQTMIEKDDEILKPHISEIFEKSSQRFGARKIKAKLNRLGLIASEKRIFRLMKEMGLSCSLPKQKNNSCYPKNHKYYPNRLKRNFSQLKPNLVWVGDITYVKVKNIFYYICVIMDLFSRKVLSFKISKNIDSDLVMKTFKKAYKSRRSPQNLLFHSDQGSQYIAYKFRSYLRGLKVRQSFSNTGTPYDNAVIESFFDKLKREELSRHQYNSVRELGQSVTEYVQFYNDYRPHASMNNLTPNEVEAQYYQSIKKRTS